MNLMTVHVSMYLWHTCPQYKGIGFKNSQKLSCKSMYSFVFSLEDSAQEFWKQFLTVWQTNTNYLL